ncbi:MAG TPA: filamentous hemagglutinin family protein [Rhizomicrobium sp.]|jgi:filamentous hemagglutinin family protein
MRNLSTRKSLLLGGASFAAMLLMAPMAYATTFTGMTGKMTSAVPNTVATKPVSSGAGPNAPNLQPGAPSQSSQDFSSALARIQAQLSAQATARSVAVAGPNNLGTAAHPLVDVVDGLAPGGLNPVANPVRAAQDTTGLLTWEGASAPTQASDASGNANVTVHQTQSRAILSWQSFNVGKKTTLNFDQQGNKDWVALNRVVGADTAPSQILGNIKADGTVLVINQNGVIFGGSSQVNVHSLVASTLDVGSPGYFDGNTPVFFTIAQRNRGFLDNGFLGAADATPPTNGQPNIATVFEPTSATAGSNNTLIYGPVTGSVQIDAGATITSGDSGYILLTGPNVSNAGHLISPTGQVVLAAGDELDLIRATGAAGTPVDGLRGFVPMAVSHQPVTETALNASTGLIEAPQGSAILASASLAINQGIISATTSVSRNGSIQVSAPDIILAPGSMLTVTPDGDGGVIPQDAVSLADFKPSSILVGNLADQYDPAARIAASVDIGSGALLFAPGGDIAIGAAAGPNVHVALADTLARVFIDDGAIIDVAGLTDILIPANRNLIKISPLKQNELADDPAYKTSFLNGATVYVDPRLSGVRDDGVAWVGSPLIDAASYYQQVGISVQELMTKGGNLIIGTDSFSGPGPAQSSPNVVVKSGANINIAGGWVTYQPGIVQTTKLITADGRVVDIGNADVNDDFVGIYNGYVVNHPRWALHDTYTNSLIFGAYYAPSYSEGRDAGSLTLRTSALTFDGTLEAGVFDGPLQLAGGQPGTAAATMFGDERTLQAVPSQLPTGGMLFVQAEAVDVGTLLNPTPSLTRGGDILVQAASAYQSLGNDVTYGQDVTTAADGSLALSTRDPESFLTDAQLGTIRLSDSLLSESHLAQVSLATSGSVTVAAGANVTLAPGGIFDVLGGHRVEVDGTVSVPSGTISLATFPGGSAFSNAPAQVGDYDVVINGTLSARGRWVNDFGLDSADAQGAAWLDGGSIALYAAPRVSAAGATSATVTDLSGSILVNNGSVIDVTGGGRVDRLGKLDLSAKGGNLSFYDETSYFQLDDAGNGGFLGTLSGFRVSGLLFNDLNGGPSPYVPANPDKINAHVSIDPAAIRAQGFAGGGTFTLVSPEFAFGNNDGAASTELPLDFVSTAGFANYNISSYKTDIIANPFSNSLGGTDAILATQVLTVGAGQNINLSQSLLPSVLDHAQVAALRDLATGGDLFSVLTPGVPGNAWDRKAANLTLGGLLELDIAEGGSITGEAGASLTVSQLRNAGIIRLPGGNLTQEQVLPSLYVKDGVLGIRDLSDIFSIDPDGTIDENAISKVAGLTNAQLAGSGTDNIQTPHPIYFLGNLDAGQGIVLASGSTTDLSGVSILNPYATGTNGAPVRAGRIIGGGTITTAPESFIANGNLFQPTLGSVYLDTANEVGDVVSGITEGPLAITQVGRTLTAQAGSLLNVSGTSDVYDAPAANGWIFGGDLVATPVWSDAGSLSAQAGATLTGANILAHGGAPQAENGTLVLLDPVLAQHDPATSTANTVSADMIAAAGFDTFIALGSVSNTEDVTVDLGRGFFLLDRPRGSNIQVFNGADPSVPNGFVPTIRSGGGTLTINAPYADFASVFDEISTPAAGAPGTGAIIVNANAIDVSGILLIDQSVANATFNTSGDLRLSGVQPWQTTLDPTSGSLVTTLRGGIAANGDLTFNAGQVYPTTGSSFAITTANPTGTITFGRNGGAVPDAPYSAGGNLLVQAANIVQGGVIRVPLGALTLGGAAADVQANIMFAPATASLVLADGGITSVSANGLVIPYGTTTDQTEWYFAPTSADPLATPPQKVLALDGTDIKIAVGAGVDVTGGGDVYAYEFVPGTGGSRDVLDQLNPDIFTSNNGYQYPNKRQVYAIVPGLSDNSLAAYDPIYSSGYDLGSASNAGKRVYLDGGRGLAAGWYTLLPAKYALLPGGMRVVEETGAKNVAAGTNITQSDGSLVVSGTYGDALSGASQSQVRLFNVQSQAVFNTETKIVQTTGNSYFNALAAHDGNITPQLPVDAGRLIINPGATLTVDAVVATAASTGGRGAKIDIGGADIDILSALPDMIPADGTIRITAASLSNLKADSLLVGGTRTDNADGTTTLNVTANDILLENDATGPLSAGEVVLAAGNAITVANGAAISATGALSDTRTGAYLIGSDAVSGDGALLRVANGPERLAVRTNTMGAANLTVGAATMSGTSIGFDSSGADVLDSNLVLQDAKFVSIGAPRIGFGADPASYNGLVITGELENILSQSGARLTLRSQSGIDFAAGDYIFGDIRFDAAALSGLGGGNVNIHGGTIGLGNSNAVGQICATCAAGDGALVIDAKEIDFTGGPIATKASVLASDVPVTIDAEITVFLPAGTELSGGGSFVRLTELTPVVVPVGAALSLFAGTGLILPASADGTLAAGTVVTPATGASLTLPVGGRYYFPNGAGTLPTGTYTLTTSPTVPLPAGGQVTLNGSVPTSLTQFFGGGVTLSAANGMFAEGKGGVLDVGPANLTLNSPYIGDRATPLTAGTNAVVPDLLLASSGTVVIQNPGTRVAAMDGIPGASITIDGQAITVSGTALHATAGTIALNSASGIVLADGASIEAPGYAKSFGDSVDPVSQNAPGGRISLNAQNGDIDLGDATVSVGGGTGNGGSLVLSAPTGSVVFGAASLDGTGASGSTGGSFALDSHGAVDLAALNDKVGADGFTNGFSIHTGSGDLVLTADKTLTSGAVSLTADGGMVDIAGGIDTSGTNGGDITLYGRSGVTLESSARLNASAAGYAASDTRQARAGDVTLGTDFTSSTTNPDGSVSGASGAIAIANGALIDVSAKRPGDRLVPYYADNVEYYSYVQADQGGSVTLRAPLAGAGVNVSVADTHRIVGAEAVNLVGFKRWDLGAVAASGLYTGVAVNGVTATLNVGTDLDTADSDGTTTPVGLVNFLGDKGGSTGHQTLVDFVQGFDVSASYGNLGGLASQSNFHAQPGMDLAFGGNVTLASNWNLGAGIVDQDAALAGTVPGAGAAMIFDTALGRNVVISGQEANLLQNYTDMLYRIGGNIAGEPGVLTFRAGGTLTLNGSVTDGFFTFRDQTDPAYLSQVGNSVSNVALTVQGGCKDNNCNTFTDWSAYTSITAVPVNYLGLTLSSLGTRPPAIYSPFGTATVVATPPYDASANSAASQGSFSADANGNVAGGGDPIGSADLFPLLPQAGGATKPVSSWSYGFAAGSDLAETAALLPSVNPLRIDPSAVHADFIVQGASSYTYAHGAAAAQGGAIPDIVNIDGSVAYTLFGAPIAANKSVTMADWLDYLRGTLGKTIPDTATALLPLDPSPNPLSVFVQGLFAQFASDQGLHQITTTTDQSLNGYKKFLVGTNTLYYAMPVALLKQFITGYLATSENQQKLASFYAAYTAPPPPPPPADTVTAYTKSLVRTGTGNIDVAASGNVDLTNGAETARQVYLGGALFGSPSTVFQVGGTSIYTAGHRANTSNVVVSDPDTGQDITLNLAAALPQTSNFANAATYNYGYGTHAVGAPGILIADPQYLEGGGDIAVSAGHDVEGRRDGYLSAAIQYGVAQGSWIGAPDEPWRTGSVGANTAAAIDPQLFAEGIGALGGGNITVNAGRNVSDISVIATDSLLTAAATGNLATSALATFGSGNVDITAGSDLLGGRVDVGSGTGSITAGRNIGDAGSFNVNQVRSSNAILVTNLLTLRITDATVAIAAGNDVDIQGVAALGVQQEFNNADETSNVNAYGLYSPNSVLAVVANGGVTVANQADNLQVGGFGGVAVYPGTFEASALTGNLAINTDDTSFSQARSVLLAPSPTGNLQLLAAGDIAPASIAMLDGDPGLLPGPFSAFRESNGLVVSGIPFAFPSVLPNTTDAQRQLEHKQAATHAGDAQPVRIVAGNDIGNDEDGLILAVPKQARIEAGRDIVNMMFFGQNLDGSDVTRIAAGRDITASTTRIAPVISDFSRGPAEPTLLGNTFVIGGPGSFILEAGRDIGPFLNSASVTEFSGNIGTMKSANSIYGGGVLSVGNEWNPWLPEQGADVSVLFGVAGGVNYDAFRQAYLDPASFAAMPDYLFEQQSSDIVSGGITTVVKSADRSKPIYGPMLVAWMQANAAGTLSAAYGTTNVSYEQAYAAFASLPVLNQRAFLNKVYFDELKETSDPASPSYLQYARGYTAVNTLFPASDGYTQNDLSGGSNGANSTVETGNLDLRLATIQTSRGGDVTIMGPGGRVLAGSTVRTSEQAARRTYGGGLLLQGTLSRFLSNSEPENPNPSAINAIPPGYEGVLTLRGGDISTFTDGDFLLNQSRLFTEQGGNIIMWSSNADLNAGQGPKTSANFPPVVVKVSQDLFTETDQVGATTGAGIAALQASPDAPPSNVYLIAPRGTVDAGDAGIRVSGDFFVAALAVANADNIQVQGRSFGLPPTPVTNLTLTTASTAATEAASIANNMRAAQPATTVEVEVTGFGGDFNQPDLCVPSAGNSCSPGSR